MSIEAVKEYLKAYGRDQDIKEFPVSSATVALAAEALGVDGARIAKTLSFLGKEDQCLLILAAGDARIDNHKFKETFSCKAKMLTPEQALEYTGHAIGGVCPFAITDPRTKVYLDVSLKRFSTVFPACGSPNSAIELDLNDLEQLSNSLGWVDVCKLPE